MESILIKDTTPEQRRKIVMDSINQWSDSGCDIGDSGIDYEKYINGEKELAQLNAEYQANYIVAYPEEQPKNSCSM
ncbi:MAG: hypothetical protein MJ174_06240 [Treponema sp.]|nr:hypothetical protein [Treponema sp.]